MKFEWVSWDNILAAYDFYVYFCKTFPCDIKYENYIFTASNFKGIVDYVATLGCIYMNIYILWICCVIY